MQIGVRVSVQGTSSSSTYTVISLRRWEEGLVGVGWVVGVGVDRKVDRHEWKICKFQEL